VELIGPSCFMRSWDSFAIIRLGHLFCLDFENELYFEDQDETIIFPFK